MMSTVTSVSLSKMPSAGAFQCWRTGASSVAIKWSLLWNMSALWPDKFQGSAIASSLKRSANRTAEGLHWVPGNGIVADTDKTAILGFPTILIAPDFLRCAILPDLQLADGARIQWVPIGAHMSKNHANAKMPWNLSIPRHLPFKIFLCGQNMSSGADIFISR